MVDEPRMHLRVRRQHSQFRLILVRFMHYYSPFGGPREIFMIDDTHGAFACRSSTLAILADPGPFHGLLLTVLGPQSDFHGCLTPWCAYVSIINKRILGRF